MGILHQLFEIPSSENITKKLGNMLISGERKGSEKLHNYLLKDLLYDKKTIFIANGMLTDKEHEDILNFLRLNKKDDVNIYDFKLNGSSNNVNILSAFENADQKAEFIKTFLATSISSEPLLKKASSFYKYAIKALDELGETYDLMYLSGLDVSSVVDLINSSPLPEEEKNRYVGFLEDSTMYSAYLEIAYCMEELKSCGLLKILSGNLNIMELLSSGNIIMLSGMVTDVCRNKESLFNVFFYVLSKCLEKYIGESEVSLFIKDSDFISGEYIRNMLEFHESYKCASYIFVEDITKYKEKNGNTVLEKSDSFLVFRQGSDQNAKCWSDFFGSRDRNRTDFSFTKKKGLFSILFSWLFSGGVVDYHRNYDSTTTSVRRVNEPIYKPEIFRELKDKEVMIYFYDSDRIRRKKRTIG